MTDPQKQRLYDAEHRLCFMLEFASVRDGMLEWQGSRVTLPLELKFGDLTTIQRYCDHVCDELGVSRVRVVGPRQGVKNRDVASYRFDEIYIPIHTLARNEWATRELIVLHELAHHVARLAVSGQGHGPEFAAAFLDLIERRIGPEVAWLLRTLFDDHQVVYKVKEMA